MELAERNAAMILEKDHERLQMDEARSSGAVREIEALTGLSGISRMEAFDISNISGVESVGSMVVYEDGKPKKSDYRKFRIRTVAGPDDYSSMQEAHSFSGTEGRSFPEAAGPDPDGRRQGPGECSPGGAGQSGTGHPRLRHGQG